MHEYEILKLENQLCFPLYAAAKEVVRKYTPFLEAIGLTYTQYIAMMVLWEQQELSVKELGQYLYLDSGTLTPLLKKLERSGLIRRTRSSEDERVVTISITEQGKKLREAAKDIPSQMGRCISLEAEEATTLYALLYKLLGQLTGCANTKEKEAI